jgi:hypothetical protein
LALHQTSTDEQAQAPQALGLSGSTPGSWISIKGHLKGSLKLCAKVMVVLGCPQHRVHHSD